MNILQKIWDNLFYAGEGQASENANRILAERHALQNSDIYYKQRSAEHYVATLYSKAIKTADSLEISATEAIRREYSKALVAAYKDLQAGSIYTDGEEAVTPRTKRSYVRATASAKAAYEIAASVIEDTRKNDYADAQQLHRRILAEELKKAGL